jgi:GPH family glycoside/pentoside/hexuronide:cation symporter
LYTEMYEEEEERATVVAIKDTIAFTSSMIGVIIPPLVAAAIGWTLAGIVFGITIPITMYLSLLGTKERKEYQIDEPLPVVAAFKETLANKSFLNIALTYTMIDYAFGLTLMALPIYSLFVLGVDEALMGFAAAGVVLGTLISIPFWRWIYAKKGPKLGLILAIGIYAVGIWPVFLMGDFLVLILCTIFPGFGVGGMIMTEPAISASIDVDELRTGKRREASYTGIFTLIVRLSIVLAGLTLIIVQLFTGFNSEAASQSPSAIIGLKLLVSLIPCLGAIIGLLIFLFFPINFKKFCENQEKLKDLHEKRLLKVKNA